MNKSITIFEWAQVYLFKIKVVCQSAVWETAATAIFCVVIIDTGSETDNFQSELKHKPRTVITRGKPFCVGL